MNDTIVVRGAREHNLRNVDLDLPRDRLIVFTGLSGSGKSSLAFDTIYAEGQRRYVESLSAYARQFLGQMDKPDVDFIEGLSPAISIDQKSGVAQPALDGRHDHRDLRLPAPALRRASASRTAPTAGASSPARRRSRSSTGCSQLPEGTRFQVLAPVVRGPQGRVRRAARRARRPGLRAGAGRRRARRARRPSWRSTRVRAAHDRGRRRPARAAGTGIERRLTDSLETALRLAEGVAEVEIVPQGRRRRGAPRSSPSPSTSPAPTAGCRSRSSRPATSRSTRRTARARSATGSAPASRSIPSSSSPTTTSRSTRARSRRGRVPRRVLQRVLDRGGRGVRLRHVDAVEEARRPQPEDHPLRRRRASRCTVKYRNRYGRQRRTRPQYEGVVPWLSGATPKRSPIGCASRSRATCARCRAPRAAARGCGRSRSR